MAPQQKRRLSAKAKAEAAAVSDTDMAGLAADNAGDAGSAATAPLPTAFEPVVGINAAHTEHIDKCVRAIKNHPVFEDIIDKNPLTQLQGGREAPFNLAGFTARMLSHSTAKAGCNFWWQCFNIDQLQSHVPIKHKKVAQMAATRFATPTHIGDIHIACSAGFNPLENKGRLRRVSPSEPVHAMIMAMYRDIQAGDENVIEAWRDVCLSTCMVFERCENNDDFHWKHLQLRENPGIDFELVRQSSLQRILDVMNFQSRHYQETKVGGQLSLAG